MAGGMFDLFHQEWVTQKLNLIEIFLITNNGANILISSVTIDDEMCGNSAGGIDITVQGGATALPGSNVFYAWQ